MNNHNVFINCLHPLLSALGWQGSLRQLKESMPHFSEITSVKVFLSVLENLQFEVNHIHLNSIELDYRILPVLLVTEHSDMYVLLEHENKEFRLFNSATNQEEVIAEERLQQLIPKGTLYTFKVKKAKEDGKRKKGWFWSSLKANKGLLYSALFLSFILNFLMLATSVFVIVIYDYVINAASYVMLIEFTIGLILALVGMYLIYRIRAEHLSLLGARFNAAIGNQIMSQLLYLSPIYTETAAVGAQIARIKDFDRLREFVSGPMLNVFFDLPFVVIGLTIIAFVGGVLVFIPFVAMALFLLTSFITSIKIKISIQDSAKGFSHMQEFLLEAIESIKILKYTNRVKEWDARYRDLSAKTNLLNVKLALYDAINTAISEFVLMIAGIAVLVVGSLEVMGNALNVGLLLGTMMIVWRILGPLKSIVTSLPRLLQLNSSVRQIEKLMELPSEATQIPQVKKGKLSLRGDIDFVRVSMRYPNAYNPSLLGVNFTIPAGSFVAVTGRNGSGKSTLLKVLLALYMPQAGAILIDGHDIRQLNPLDLRASIGYLPQDPEIFFGTIESNLRLGDPVASQAEIHDAAAKAGILATIDGLDEQFKTKVYDQQQQNLSASFCQSLCLARAYLRDAPILLLDEPGNTLDKAADEHLLDYLCSLRGKKTIIMVTHRPSHWRRADKVFVMEEGQLISQGTPEEMMPLLQPMEP